MSELFNVGDVVVCWRRPSGYIESLWEPSIGGIYKVYDVDEGENDEPLIDLYEDPERGRSDSAWDALAFKHLPRADERFIEQMLALKPTKVLA